MNTSTDQRDIVSDPMSHPDFVLCNDPRLDTPHPRPIVYVPSLVYLVHRLGGLGGISGDYLDPSILRVGGRVIVEAIADINEKTDRWWLDLVNWYPAAPLLSVSFELPARWHLAEWAVAHVSSEDTFSLSTELDTLIAKYCDRRIGRSLARS
jgi:hypothetical protein